MATVTGMTAAAMALIKAASVVSGAVVGDNLILTTQGGSTIDAGNVRGPQGAVGATGPAGSPPTPAQLGISASTGIRIPSANMSTTGDWESPGRQISSTVANGTIVSRDSRGAGAF